MGESARDFFSKEDLEEIKFAITDAELDTSGEIRVHVENFCKGEVLDRASFVFRQLGMIKTEKRNGVLIYLAVKNRRFAILGDVGINRVVPSDFWDSIKHSMLNHFRESRFKEGLIIAIAETGKHLKKYFPHKKEDVNELPDDVSFGDEITK